MEKEYFRWETCLNIIRIYVFCEGQTEETFINEVLKFYFQRNNIYLSPILLGGGNTWGRIKRQIEIKCKQDKEAWSRPEIG